MQDQPTKHKSFDEWRDCIEDFALREKQAPLGVQDGWMRGTVGGLDEFQIAAGLSALHKVWVRLAELKDAGQDAIHLLLRDELHDKFPRDNSLIIASAISSCILLHGDEATSPQKRLWKELQGEFLQYADEHAELRAVWTWEYTEADLTAQLPPHGQWILNGGGPSSQHLFKEVVRRAAGRVPEAAGAEPWRRWLDLMRGEGYASKVMPKTVSHRRFAAAVKLSKDPPRPPGFYEEQIESLFKSSADFCFVRSLAAPVQSVQQEGNEPTADAKSAGFGLEQSGAGSTARGRKRGPKTDHEGAARVAEIVARVGDWKAKLDETCEALDAEAIPYPKTWPRREYPLNSWEDGATLEPGLARKAIEDRLELAKQRKKLAPETFS